MSGSNAITIGVFDGVHRGHAALIAAARSAVGGDGKVVALAFEPHPSHVLQGGRVTGLLSSFAQRQQWLTEAGADEIVPLEPTTELLGKSPESFLDGVIEAYDANVIVEGADFRFGRKRSGSADTLREHGRAHGYRAIVLDHVEAALGNGMVVRISSSLIRHLVRHGRVRDAAVLLGRPYELRGEIVHGDGRGGSELGVPTANLDHTAALLPADGIYAGTAVGPAGRRWPAAVSIGTKPTFGENPRVCEAHLIDYEGAADEYGWAMTLQFHDWIRDQITYDGVEPLIEQVHRDIARVRQAIDDRRLHEPALNR